MSKFRIGDRVRVDAVNSIGTVEDIFRSESNRGDLYSVMVEGHSTATVWRESELEEYKDNVSYTYETECLENIVLVRLYELRDESKTEIARSHGHIIHEGALGVAQAASYAMKRIFFDISNREDEYAEN